MTASTPDIPSSRWWLIFAAAGIGFALYYATCAPGVLWQDSAIFQFRVWHGDLRGELGLPLAHPFYILLAKLFTFFIPGDFAFRVNLFSALCGALSIALVMHLLLTLTHDRLAAMTGSILLAVSHTFWTHSVIAEVYSLYGLALLAELCVLERFFRTRNARWFILLLCVNGLNLSNHLMALLHLPAYMGVLIWAYRAKMLSRKHLPVCGAAYLIGTLPYTALVLADIIHGQPLIDTLRLALVGPPHFAHKVLAISFPLWRQIVRTALYFLLNFPTPLLLLAPLGLWGSWNHRPVRRFALVAGGIFLVGFIFAFRYLVPDQFAFFTPCYVLIPFFVGLGVSYCPRRSRVWGLAFITAAVLPALVYEVAPSQMRKYTIAIGVRREIPFRDTYAYFIRPRKNGETGAMRFARSAFNQASPAGLLIADSTINNVLVYVRDIEGAGRRITLTRNPGIPPTGPAIDLQPDAIQPFVDSGTAYVCTDSTAYLPRWIWERYDLRPVGFIFQLSDRPTR